MKCFILLFSLLWVGQAATFAQINQENMASHSHENWIQKRSSAAMQPFSVYASSEAILSRINSLRRRIHDLTAGPAPQLNEAQSIEVARAKKELNSLLEMLKTTQPEKPDGFTFLTVHASSISIVAVAISQMGQGSCWIHCLNP